MRIASNKIIDILNYFRSELSSVYDKDEIEEFAAMCFHEFAGFSKTDILLEPGRTVNESQLLKFSFAVKDLKHGRPIQYILGKSFFYGSEFLVNENVLIPRPETEELVRFVLDDARAHPESFSLVDLGTGSGCIALTLKKNLPRCHVYAVDKFDEALNTARQNAENLELKVHWIKGDMTTDKLAEQLPACLYVVSNPPYVKDSESAMMHKNVLEHEPHTALFVPDDNALLFYESIASIGLKKLRSGGKIFVEINEALGLETAILFQKAGYSDVQIKKDMQGKDRVVIATLKR